MTRKSAIIIEPGEVPRHVHISTSLKNLQNIVGGRIETVTPLKNMTIICNEEGRVIGLPYCCTLFGVDFCGTVILIGVKGDDFADFPISFAKLKKLCSSLWDLGGARKCQP